MLTFPFPQAPAAGTTLELVAGVRWLRMPLPIDLDHINLYLIEDSDGWYIVDTGMATDETKRYWQQIFDEELDKPIKGVICTHFHVDHAGLAGWLTNKWQVPFYMSELEYYYGKASLAPQQELFNWQAKQNLQRCGIPLRVMESFPMPDVKYDQVMGEMPHYFNRLNEADELMINGNSWKVLIGNGHCPAHASLYCKALNILLSGDQVIAAITSHVGVNRNEPASNTVEQWLASLPRFFELPADTLTCPAHKLPFIGLHERTQELLDHHYGHFEALLGACQSPKKVIELVPVMFKRPLQGFNFILGMAECLAHLNCLLERGQLQRTEDEQGCFIFQASVE